MSLRENYIKLSKNLGGTHSLISKGLKKSIVDSIMRGSDIGATKAYEVAKILGVTVEELLTGKKENEAKEEIYTTEEQKYIDKLIYILREKEEDKKTTIKTILNNLKQNTCDNDSKKSTQHKPHIKKQKAG